MKLIIDIPQEVKEAFDKASKDDINFCFYDYNSVIGMAIRNGTPLDDIKAEILEETKCPYGDKCLGANCPSNTDCMIMGEHAIWIIDKYIGERSDEEDGNK